MNKIITAFLILGSTQLIFAGKTPITKIESITTYADYAVVKIADKTTNTDNCTHSRATEYLAISLDKKGMYSSVLSAFVSGSKIRFAHSGCVSWGGTIPKVYRVDLVK